MQSQFFGRQAELQQLATTLSGPGALVTLTGPGGAGKSRLAAEFARTVGTASAVHRVPLDDATDAGSVLAATATALGVRDPSADAAGADQIARTLASLGPALLVLDGCERAVDAVAALLERWAPAAPELRVLATSRETLRAPGEVVLEVGPLPREAAMALLEDRSRAAEPMAAEVSLGIVESVERLPLAIEMAAARTAIMGPRELLERLESGLGFLRSRTRGVVPRHATLQAVTAWSWELLTPGERRALSECQVFLGGFDLAAAEAVLSTDGELVMDLVTRLVDKSLLRREAGPDGRVTFRLFDVIREFVADAAPLEEAARSRHARHFAATAEAWTAELDGPRSVEVGRAIRQARDNLVAAFDFAVQTDPELAARLAVAVERGFRSVGGTELRLSCVERALEVADGLPVALEVRLLVAANMIYRWVRRTADARAVTERAVAIADTPALQAAALICQGVLAIYGGDDEVARDSLETARDKALEAGDTLHAAWAAGELALLHLMRDLPGAERLFLDALELARRYDVTTTEAVVLNNLGNLYQEAGRLIEAREALEEAVRAGRRTGSVFFAPLAQASLAVVLLELGDPARALEVIEPMVAWARRQGDERMIGLGQLAAGAARALSDDVEGAEAALSESRRLMESGSFAGWLQSLAVYEGLLDAARGRRALAEGDAALGERRLDAAVARVAAAKEAGQDVAMSDVRTAIRLVERDVARSREVEAVRVGPGADWFEVHGEARVDLSRRGPMRRILAALLDARESHPGQAMCADAVREAGWPGERMSHASGVRRVQVTVNRLRDAGLRGLLVTRDDGYLLDPESHWARVD